MNKKCINAILPMTLVALMASCGQSPEKMFENIELTQGYKPQTEHNPLATQKFGADPYAMEYDGRVYVYTTLLAT